jgi:hypothetical protein
MILGGNIMQKQDIIHCYECKNCLKNRRSKTGYSCAVWGHGDFADDTPVDGYCHKAKADPSLESLRGFRMFDSRNEADEFLIKLKAIAHAYGCVTKIDFLDMLGVKGPYVDTKYGWLDIALDRSAEVIDTPLGYFIKLPPAFPLD